MENTVLQRVIELFNSRYESNVSRMSKAISVNPATLAYQLNGKRSISLDTITAIANVNPDIPLRWLLLGTGNMVEKFATIITQQSGECSQNTNLHYN